MSTATRTPPPRTANAPGRPWWRRAALPVTLAWSAATTLLAARWVAGAPGNPAVVDTSPHLALHGALGARATAWLLLVLGVAGLLLGAAMLLQRSRARAGAEPGPAARTAVVAGAVAAGLVLALALPDFRLLATLGYLPMLLVMGALGRLPEGFTIWTRPDVDMLVWTVVGLAFVAAGLDHRRRLVGDVPALRVLGPAVAARWAPWAVAVAVTVPVGYAVTRFAWALGIPLLVRPELLDELGSAALVGAGLATLAVVGAVLTLGLVQRWGRVVPGWVPGIGGRDVPVGLALVPASFVSVAVASAGLMFTRLSLVDGIEDAFPGTRADVGAWLPELFWPLWGLALFAAAHAYRVRRAEV